jgi:TctA family transporter
MIHLVLTVLAVFLAICLIPAAMLLTAKMIYEAVRAVVVFVPFVLIMLAIIAATEYSRALVIAVFVIAFAGVFVAHARKTSKNPKTPDYYFG